MRTNWKFFCFLHNNRFLFFFNEKMNNVSHVRNVENNVSTSSPLDQHLNASYVRYPPPPARMFEQFSLHRGRQWLIPVEDIVYAMEPQIQDELAMRQLSCNFIQALCREMKM